MIRVNLKPSLPGGANFALSSIFSYDFCCKYSSLKFHEAYSYLYCKNVYTKVVVGGSGLGRLSYPFQKGP